MRKAALLILLLFSQIVFCEDLKTEVSKESVYLGEVFTLKAGTLAKENMTAVFAGETKDVAILGVEKGDDGNVIIKMITLVSGELTVPQIDLTIDGNVFNIGQFKVSSMNRTAENDMNLRDIKETVKIMEKDYTLLYVLAFLLAIAALIFLFLKLRKRFAKKVESAPQKIEPSEVAAKFIKEAKAKRESGDNEAFVDLSTLGLKTYMSLISDLNYTEMTTSEVKRALKKDKLFSAATDVIVGILKLGDRFKFADDTLSESDFDRIIDGFAGTVRETEKGRVVKNDAA